MVVVPVGKMKPAGTPVRMTVTEPLHAPSSVASATPNSSSSNAEHDEVVTLTFAGTVRTGGVVSAPLPAITVTFCTHDATLPLRSSVAVHVMVVRPAGNGSVKGRSSLLRVVTVTSSEGLVVGVPIVAAGIVASHAPPAALKVTLAGHEIVTGSRSPAATTVMIWVQFAERLPASVTVQVIPVLPIGYGSFTEWTTP